jgi:hypothetical protein
MTNIENINISVASIFLEKLKKPSIIALILITLFSLFTYKYWVVYPDHPFHNDIDQYYSYLVAQFIHHDLGFHFTQYYWLIEAPNHQLVPKVTMGLAFLYLPFFVIADNIADAYNYDPLGYSAPYGVCVHFGTLFYTLVGFWYTRKSLIIFFNEWVVALSLLLILFGTNLFYYVYREGEMTHSYLFFLFSVFMYHAIKWNFSEKNKHLYFMSFIAGLVVLIRPTEILILLIPLLYQVTTIKDMKLKLIKLINLKWKLLLVILLFLLPIIPQLLYWKKYTGQFFFFSYGSSERFFFNDPQIVNILFSWQKGWFIYTPMMIFVLIGLILMFKKWKNMFVPVFVYIAASIYLVSSWWDWGFGGAHGMRALVQSYAFLVFPLAFFINWMFTLKIKWVKICLIPLCFSLFGFFMYLNVFQVWQFKNSLLHWDSMSKQSYMYTFLRKDFTDDDRKYLETLFIHPNYEERKKGNRDE